MSERAKLPDREEILEHLRTSSRGPLKPKELSRALDVPNETYRDFKDLLRRMEGEGTVYQVKGNRYAVPEKINLVVGRLSVIKKGDGFVQPDLPEEEDEDIFVPARNLESAMHGDRVVARIEGRPRDRNPVGRIIKILDRAHSTVVGTYHRDDALGFVDPQDPKLQRDVLIPRGNEGDARDGQVVVVSVTSFGDRKLNPRGRVENVLGYMDDPGVDVLSILYGHGLPLEFPDGVEEEARTVADENRTISPVGRSDRRDLHVFTIDPADAKDHDDALSVEEEEGGRWEVGIHIADVSHYVEPGSRLDREALERGTSVYLVDRVVPMLPHALSSDLCSLRPDEDRYAVSLFVTLDEDGAVRDHRFERTVIRSRRRLSYEEVEEVLDGSESVDAETDRAIHLLNDLAETLRVQRDDRGSLDFDLPEARVILGDEGEPVDIQRVQRLESHRLIEDFMLLANELVARKAAEHEIPILYRIHESPPKDKMGDLRDFLATVGHTLPRGEIRPKVLQRVLERVEGKPAEDLVSTVILRSMSRARYSPKNQGHFGLAADSYTHFTSPIRRYPDLLVHRVVVRAFIEGGEVPDEWSGLGLEEIAEHTSDRGRVADEAERDSVDLKKTEYMERHLGDEFTGTIAGVTSFGFFVLLDDVFVEGLVHVNTLDDYYVFQEEQYALVGDRTRKRFQLSDRVRIQVSRVDKEERHVDFRLLEKVD